MRGRLSKLEESKLKKPVHIEIHEEEEIEEWDERKAQGMDELQDSHRIASQVQDF